MLGSIRKQSGESVESVLKKKKEGYGGKDLQKTTMCVTKIHQWLDAVNTVASSVVCVCVSSA